MAFVIPEKLPPGARPAANAPAGNVRPPISEAEFKKGQGAGIYKKEATYAQFQRDPASTLTPKGQKVAESAFKDLQKRGFIQPNASFADFLRNPSSVNTKKGDLFLTAGGRLPPPIR